MIDRIKTVQGGRDRRRRLRDDGRVVQPRDVAPRVLARAGADSRPDRGAGDVGRRKRPPAHDGAADIYSSAPRVAFDGEREASVQSIGTTVVDVTPGDYFELIALQTSGATKNVAANELTWFAIEVVE